MQEATTFLADVVDTFGTLLGNIGEFAVIAVGLYLVGRLLTLSVGRWGLERAGFDRTMVDGLTSFLHLAAMLLAVVVGASAADFRGAFAGSALIAGGVTLAVGLAAQDVLSNFVAGAFLVQDPDINVGDRIRWGDEEGIVNGIDLRVTRIRTLNNETILVPNKELATSVVENLTAHDPVGFAYEFTVQHDQIEEAVDVISAVARDHELINETPPPTVRVTELIESEVVLTARAFFPIELRPQRYRIRTSFLRRVTERCVAADVDLTQTNQTSVSGSLEVDEGADRGGENGSHRDQERSRSDRRETPGDE